MVCRHFISLIFLMAIFNSYLKLPEENSANFFHRFFSEGSDVAVLKHPRRCQEFIRFMRLFREKQLARVKMVFTKQADPQMDPPAIPAAQALRQLGTGRMF